MKRVFRSIINVEKNGKPTLPMNELRSNYRVFLASELMPEEESFITLYHWIEGHHRKYKELPVFPLLYERAKNAGNEAVVANLQGIVEQIPYTGSNYQAIVKEKREEQLQNQFQSVLTKTWQVVQSGLKVGKKELKGLTDALGYVATESRQFRIKTTGIKTEGLILSKEDTQEMLDTYERRRKDPYTNRGMFFDLNKVDYAFRGIKRGELFVIGAYVAQGKTTFTYNLAYNGICQGMNGLYVPLEMNYPEMRELFYTLHTSNTEWYSHPKYRNLAGKISYEGVRYSELTDMEHEFFAYSANDMATREDFGKFKVYQPTEPLTPSRLEEATADFQTELAEMGRTLDFLIIDYVTLMVPDKNDRSKDFNADLNAIFKKLKMLALTFNNGQGLRVITPHQINREGWKEASKNEGVYKLTALSSANESERSADGVITLFMTEEMKKSGLMKICCLKNRRGPAFVPHEVALDFRPMRLRDCVAEKNPANAEDPMAIENLALNAIPGT